MTTEQAYEGALLTIKELREDNESLRLSLRWVAQTIHQAYHDGLTENCQKNTCDHVMKALKKR